MKVQPEISNSACRYLQQAQQGPGPEVFSDVLTPEVLEQLICQEGVAEKLIEFLPDGRTVQVKAYSPLDGTFKTDTQNQFLLALDPPLR